jgi:hypothetical protein
MHRRATHWTIALQRAVGVSVAIAIALVVATWLSQRSSQADWRLAVEELRARAGEVAQVARLRDEDALPSTASRVVASQLRDRIADVRDDVAALGKKAPLPEQPRVAQIAQTVNASAERLSSDRSASDGTDPASGEVAAQVEALIAIETALRPK